MGDKASEELINQKKEFFDNIQQIENSFIVCQTYMGHQEKRDEFLQNLDSTSKDYINVIKNLDDYNLELGTSWLLSIVEHTRNTIMEFLPSFI